MNRMEENKTNIIEMGYKYLKVALIQPQQIDQVNVDNTYIRQH